MCNSNGTLIGIMFFVDSFIKESDFISVLKLLLFSLKYDSWNVDPNVLLLSMCWLC